MDETVRRRDERGVAEGGALADGGTLHQGVLVDRLVRWEADHVGFDDEETGDERDNGEYSGQRVQ